MRGLPPGPRSPPYVQLVRWIRTPLEMLASLRDAHGDIFTLRFPGGRKVVVTSSAEAMREIFSLSPDDANAGEATSVLRPFLGKHSLILLDGAEHQRQKRMMAPAFHGERLQKYGRAMTGLAHDSIDRWPIDRRFPMLEPAQEITLEVIMRTVFGVEEGPLFHELAQLLRDELDLGGWPFLLFPFMQRDLGRFSPWGRWLRCRAKTSAILRGEIQRRRASSGNDSARTDVLQMMLEASDEGGTPMSDEEIHDELLTLLVAGHETTAPALAWALRWILPDRDLALRLREEIAGAKGDPSRIARLDLLDWTIKETLRMEAVIPVIARVLKKPKTLCGWELPPGTVVSGAIPLVHRNAALYPDPDRFHPERFRDFKPAAWEFVPFGGGMRRCIGAAFAVYELKMVLAAILPRVDMELASDRVGVARRSITLVPARGLPVIVRKKRPRSA